MTDELVSRVTRAGTVLLAALAAGAWGLGGAPVAGGVLGGGAVALANFRWLAREVAGTAARLAAGRPVGPAAARLGLRQIFTFGALALLVAGGWAHPVAVAVGLAALPPVLLAQGLRDARRAE